MAITAPARLRHDEQLPVFPPEQLLHTTDEAARLGDRPYDDLRAHQGGRAATRSTSARSCRISQAELRPLRRRADRPWRTNAPPAHPAGAPAVAGPHVRCGTGLTIEPRGERARVPMSSRPSTCPVALRARGDASRPGSQTKGLTWRDAERTVGRRSSSATTAAGTASSRWARRATATRDRRHVSAATRGSGRREGQGARGQARRRHGRRQPAGRCSSTSGSTTGPTTSPRCGCGHERSTPTAR